MRRLRGALRPVCAAVWALAGALLTPAGWALPGGATPTLGATTVRPGPPGTLEILQSSSKAGIDWRSFSIAAGERVLIRQPDTASVLFNRVTGADPSLIFGQLQANGRVFLSNPRGIIFGAGSQVDVGSLVATTLSVNTTMLASGRYQLSLADGAGGGGELRMDGSIRAPGGTVALVSPNLSVGGNILAGRLGLAAAGAVQVDVDGDGLIFFNVRDDDLAGRLRVLPSASLRGGSAELRAAARSGFADTVLNLDGVVRAQGFALKGGQVVIDGGSAGVTRIAGRVDASSAADGAQGGEILVLGQKIGLTPEALLDASGSGGGGRIRVGGDFQGRNPELANAERVTVQRGAQLKADAIDAGDGGRVVVWSEAGTRYGGSISARGGARGGNGGDVEVSGRRHLDFSGTVDLSADKGRRGSLLLDPLSITVVESGPDIDGLGLGHDLSGPTLGFGDFPAKDSLITSSQVNAQLNAAVTLEAKNTITVNNTATKINGTGALTLKAGGDITIAGDITATGGITVSANDAGGTVTGSGKLVLTANLDAGSASAITISGAGTHSIGGNLSAGTLVVTGGMALVGARQVSLATGTSTIGSQIGGDGSLEKLGAGTLVLAGANTYGGGTTLAGGVLALGSSGAIGSSGTIAFSGGTLQFSAVNTTDYSARFSTAAGQQYRLDTNGQDVSLAAALTSAGGVLTKSGAGTLTLGGANGYSGGTTVAAGTLSGNADSLQGAITNNAVVVFDQAIAGTYAGAMSGSGSLVKQGGGTLTLAGSNSYGGGTTVSAGTLTGNTDSLQGAITNNAVVVFDQAIAGTYAGAMSGSGSLVKQGSATLTLTGNNSYGGGTTLEAGTL
ncbi:MAG: autotransporter-associated beta strand repeat-containing protein, partial [Burkholderiaceae bacterium]|nr:autotransporter-associated beta strand repeat-containing protein [Burkholderiaceae bacterium]